MISRRSFLQACLAGCLGLCTLSGGGCKNFHSELDRTSTAPGQQADKINLKTGFAELKCGPDTWYWQRNKDFYLANDNYLANFSDLPLSSEILSLDVAVIGSGVAGLVCADRLIELGVDKIAVFDGSSQMGGCTQSLCLNSADSASKLQYVPWASARLSLPDVRDEALLNFLRAQNIIVGTDSAGRPIYNTDSLAFYPQERLLSFGRWIFGNYDKDDLERSSSGEQEHSAAQFDEFLTEMSQRKGSDGLLYFTSPLHLVSAEARNLDNITLKSYLADKKLWHPEIEHFIDRVIRSESGLTADKISAWVGLYLLCRDHIKMQQKTSTFLTWEKGCAQLLEPIIGRLAPVAKLNFPIIGIKSGSKGLELLGLDLIHRQKRRIIARHAIFTGSCAALHKLLNRPLPEETVNWSATAFSAQLEPVIYSRKIFDAPPALINRLLNYPEVVYWNSKCQREDSLPHSSAILLRRQPQKFSPDCLDLYFKNIHSETLPFIDDFAQQAHVFWAANFGQFRRALPRQIWADNKPKTETLLWRQQLPAIHLALTDSHTAPNFAQSFHNGWQAAQEVYSALS
ncbi:MAG: NAD(P)-binding protein [Candidatus Bruticola sp.]